MPDFTASRPRPPARTRPLKRPPGRPAGSNGEAMRRDILQAALRAFAAHGYAAMSVRDLARELGVSHNLVHHHYGTKDDLWRAALEHGFAPSARELVSLISSNSRAADWETTVRTSVKDAFKLLAGYPEATAILVHESARGGARLNFLFDHYMRPFADLLTILLDGRGGGRRSDIDPRAAMLFLFSGMTALFTHRGLVSKLGGPAPTSRGELERYADSIAEFITHGLTRPGKRSSGRTAARPRPKTKLGESR